MRAKHTGVPAAFAPETGGRSPWTNPARFLRAARLCSVFARSRTRARGLLDPGEAAVHERLLGSQSQALPTYGFQRAFLKWHWIRRLRGSSL